MMVSLCENVLPDNSASHVTAVCTVCCMLSWTSRELLCTVKLNSKLSTHLGVDPQLNIYFYRKR